MPRILPLLLATLALAHAAIAPARACARRLAADLPLAAGASNPLVSGRVNDHPVRLYLDTGAEYTILTKAAAARLALPTDWFGLQPLWGVGGLTVNFNARIARLEVGALVLDKHSMPVAEFGATWGVRSDGLLGGDIVSTYDLDLDIGHGRVGLYDTVRCATPVPGWKLPYSRVPLRDLGPSRTHALTTLTLDGTTLTVAIDTGAERSVISREAALRAGASEAALADDITLTMVGVGSATRAYRVHRFHMLRIGGEAWRGAELMVGQMPPFVGDMLLGADFLAQHRVWISWKNHTMFVAHAPDRRLSKRPGEQYEAGPRNE